jgi:hypothetical protein
MRAQGIFSLIFSLATTLVFAGCYMPQARNAVTPHIQGFGSAQGPRVGQNTSSGDLLYVSGGTTDEVYVFSYSDGTLLQTLTGFQYPIGECSDSAGDVYITNLGGDGDIDEFVHGASNPTRVLTGASSGGNGCSVDPTTGSVAVPSAPGTLAVWGANPSSPTIYKNTGVTMLFCGYDDKGNLFVDGGYSSDVGFYELPAGKSSFTQLAIKRVTVRAPGQVQWDGTHMTIQDGVKPGTIYRFNISGQKAVGVDSVNLSGINKSLGASWIEGNTVVVPFGVRPGGPKRVGYWPYPAGGKPKMVLGKFHFTRRFEAATVSLGSGRFGDASFP